MLAGCCTTTGNGVKAVVAGAAVEAPRESVVPSSSGTVPTAAAAGCSVEAVAGSGEAGARANFRALLAGIQSFAAVPDVAQKARATPYSSSLVPVYRISRLALVTDASWQLREGGNDER